MTGVVLAVAFHLPVAAQGEIADSDTPEVPLVATAWEAGCLTLEECAALATALQNPDMLALTQQGVARTMAPERRQMVLGCLRELPEWQAAFRAGLVVAQSPQYQRMHWRWDLRPSSTSQPALEGRLTWAARRSGRRMTSLRASFSEGLPRLDAASIMRPITGGDLWVGALVGRFGQGLVLWTPGAYDDLGGIAGSHRIGRGMGSAGYRREGMVMGLGLQDREGLGRKGRRWTMLGRLWPHGHGVFAIGTERRHWSWACRVQPRMARGIPVLVGLDGRGRKGGWSWRWAWAAFAKGWVARTSLLYTLSRQLEGYVVLERSHPGHPDNRTGNAAVNTMTLPVLPGWHWSCGLDARGGGNVSGWARWRVDAEGPPPYRWQRRSAFRVEAGGHRMDARVRWSEKAAVNSEGAGYRGGAEWTLALSSRGRTDGEGRWTWRVYGAFSGEGGRRTMGVAFISALKDENGSTWRWGFGQSWGDQGGPTLSVPGWDGRPAEGFGRGAFKGYFRWRSASGRWRCGVRMAMAPQEPDATEARSVHGIHAFRVEFQPFLTPARKG